MENQDPIKQLLDHQVQQLEALQRLLKEELEALKHRDIEKINDISQQKTHHLTALQQADAQLAPLLASKENANHNEARQQIELMLETCKQLNEINGQALKMSMAGLARLQSMLAGVRNEKAGVTYDQTGQAKSGGKLGHGFKV
ncbi:MULTISPECIES: flagellar protein FlgN [Corallincola]|uniref:flagellar protein FlgN n=1 Tax=Corallincola TaxID=1775176 RepID=UPI001314A683|nr:MULTISPECIES: flagellar protein FlgN [Corallincola]